MRNEPTRLLIWGGGHNFRRALPILRAREQRGEIRIVGIIDRSFPEFDTINGYPHVEPEDILGIEYDSLLTLSAQYRREIREEYLKIPGIDRGKFANHVFPELDMEKYRQLVNDRPTIFSSTCWGGLVYYHLGMECISPFKNLWLYETDFLKFLHDPRGYMAEDPVPDHMQRAYTKYDVDLFPVLRLGDITLHCNHSHTMEEAISDWLRRREKINWDFIIAQMNIRSHSNEKEFSLIDTVDRKVCMVPYITTEPYSIQVLQNTDEEKIWLINVNATAFPFHNPVDIYSLFYGEWEDNPCYEPV